MGLREMSSRWVFQCHGSGSPIASNASLLQISDGLTDRAQSLHMDFLLLSPSVFLRRTTQKYWCLGGHLSKNVNFFSVGWHLPASPTRHIREARSHLRPVPGSRHDIQGSPAVTCRPTAPRDHLSWALSNTPAAFCGDFN